MNTKLIAAVIAVVVVIGGFYFWHEQASAPSATVSTKEARNWSFQDAGPNDAGNPQTTVSLNGRVVGTYEGTCSEISGTNWTLVDGEDSGVVCWFAGGGMEIGVFGNAVKQGALDEGSAETPGTRGNFKTLFTL